MPELEYKPTDFKALLKLKKPTLALNTDLVHTLRRALEALGANAATALNIPPTFEVYELMRTKFQPDALATYFPNAINPAEPKTYRFDIGDGKIELWRKTENGFQLLSELDYPEEYKAVRATGNREFDMSAALTTIDAHPYLAETLGKCIGFKRPLRDQALRRAWDFVKFCFDPEAVQEVATYLQANGIILHDTSKKSIFELLKDAEEKTFSGMVDELRRVNRIIDRSCDSRSKRYYTGGETNRTRYFGLDLPGVPECLASKQCSEYFHLPRPAVLPGR